MSTQPNPAHLPTAPLVAIGVFVVCTLIAVTWVRLSGVPIHTPDAPAVQERALRFEDQPDGSIAVMDVRSGKHIAPISGQAGFVRGTLRGLARERKRQGIGAEPAFLLIGRSDGSLTLQDPSTGRVVDLASFGPLNSGVFAQMLNAPLQP
jgi:putative photosynthetic complex assembly protein